MRLVGLPDELVALKSWIEPPQMLQTCHRDLWADNVLPTASGSVCVIDWENSGPADPSQELACVLFEFGRVARISEELGAIYQWRWHLGVQAELAGLTGGTLET